MHVLLVDAFDPTDPDRHLAEAVAANLAQQGNEVQHHRLVDEGFTVAMSTQERQAYHTETPLCTDETRRAAAAVKAVDAIVFCHPSTLFGLPPVLKGWIDRVLVFGVAFEFGRTGRVRPALRTIRRIGVVTSTRQSRWRSLRVGNLGNRTLVRSLWLICNRTCRISTVGIPTGTSPAAAATKLERRFRRWR